MRNKDKIDVARYMIKPNIHKFHPKQGPRKKWDRLNKM